MASESLETTRSQHSERMNAAMRRFSEGLNELREFSELAQALLNKHKLEELESSILRYQGLAEALGAIDKRLESDIKYIATPEGEGTERDISFEISERDTGRKFFRVHGSRTSIREFDERIKTIFSADKSIRQIQNSSLISLVSTAESFISSILHIFYEAHPKALNAKDKQFTYDELSSFKTIEDAKLSVVSWRIENLLRGSVEEWIDFFEKQLKLKIPNARINIRPVVEIFQRRNLLVHNDGVINNIYISKTGAHDSALRLGKKLTVSKKYLGLAIDKLELVFLEIAYQLWMKVDSQEPSRGEVLVVASYDSILKERFEFGIDISRIIDEDKHARESEKLMCQVNRWLCMRGLGLQEAVLAEVQAFDFSAKGDLFKLAKACLLGDHEDTARRVRALLSASTFSPDEFNDWPLFAEFRSSEVGKIVAEEINRKLEEDRSPVNAKKRKPRASAPVEKEVTSSSSLSKSKPRRAKKLAAET